MQCGQGGIDGIEVTLHDLAPLATVSLFYRMLDLFDGFISWQYAGDGKETGLHDGVDTPSHARRLGDSIGIDDPQFDILVQHFLLHGLGKGIPDLIRCIAGIEQEYRTIGGFFQQVETLRKLRLVAADKAGFTIFYEITGSNGARAETQMGDGHCSRFLRIIDEVALHELVGLFTDDLQRILVGTYRTIRTQPVEQALDDTLHVGIARTVVPLQAGMGNIVVYADGELILRLFCRKIGEHCPNHPRRKFLRGQSIAATENTRQTGEFFTPGGDVFGKASDYILVQGFTCRPRLLATIQHRNAIHRCRQGIE